MMQMSRWFRLVGSSFVAWGLAACGPAGVTEMPESAPCVSTRGPDRYVLLVPPPERADGVRFFTASGGAPTELAPTGRPCGGAKDPGACDRAVQTLVQSRTGRTSGWVAPGGSMGGPFDFAIVTHGDDVSLVDRADTLAELVAPITTPEKAAVVHAMFGGELQCGARNMETLPNAWLFQALGEKCDQGQNEAIWRVTREGRRELVSSRNVCAVPQY
ncbi:MAG: hypothetical protein U0235_13075 [Polyangiaceae bacterium]